jgi:alpha-L-rhamnosidase
MKPRVSAVRFEHHRDELGIGEASPRLSWRTEAPPGWRQAGYEVGIYGDPSAPFAAESGESVLVPWPAHPLASRQRHTVRVRVHGTDGTVSGWSTPAHVEAGLLVTADWTASMITPEADPAPLLRREFTLDGDSASARLYITAHGLYEAYINGIRVGDDALTPGWTSYSHRLRYQTYDVTGLLRRGQNAIGAQLADGWYRGRLTFVPGKREIYGDRLGLLGQLEILLAEGTTVVVGTDESWRSSTGPVVSADLYDGEHYDARREQDGWSQPGFDDSAWLPCRVEDFDAATLVAPDGPPVRATDKVAVRNLTTSASGKTLLDFGQNLVGRLRVRVTGPRGAVVTLRHAEVLENGELGVRPLRTAKATDRYTLRGDADGETWEPRFTFHGFRYAEISGDHDTAEAIAVVYHSDMERTGWFECSDPLLNKLHENVVWGMRGNFVDIPTDCPQRDERLGWTGDLQVFAPTASYLYDCAGFLTSWLADLAADQTPEGVVPIFVPRIDLQTPFGDTPPPSAGWGDAAVLVPWTLYQRFGDIGILRRQYRSMRAWVDGLTSLLGERALFDRPPFQFGDWLDPAAPPDNPGAAATDPILVATAYRARVAQVLSDIAAVLGEDADSAKYAQLAQQVRRAFHDEYVTPHGRIASDSQTAYALGLEFALLTDGAQRQRAAERLVEAVRLKGHTIATGFLGTPLICDALVTAGALDDAYQLLLQKQCPSWLYPVTMGATTIWERWDSMLPDGSINPGGMTSFNHYAFGAIADFLHRVVGGLAPAEPGYRTLAVAPRPGGGISSATTAHLTRYGRAQVAWRRADGQLTAEVLVPAGCRALVTLPGLEPTDVGAGQHHYECAYRDPADDPAYVHPLLAAAAEFP